MPRTLRTGDAPGSAVSGQKTALFLLCPPMKLSPFSCWATRSLRLSASLLACCCIWLHASEVRAELTQAQLQQAFYDALMQWGSDTTGESGIPAVLPVDVDLQDLAYYLEANGTTVSQQTRDIWNILRGDNPVFYRFLRTLSPSNQIDVLLERLGTPGSESGVDWRDGIGPMLARWYADWNAMMYEHLYPKLEWLTYTDRSELMVHDEQTHADLLDIYTRLDILGAIYDRLGDSYSFGENLSSNIYEMGDRIIEWNEDYWNEDPDPYKSDGESEGESGYDEEEDEAKDEWEEIQPPSVDDGYRPDVEDVELEGEDLGLSDVADPGDHNALVRLVRGVGNTGMTENGIPEIEIDFGRMATLESNMRSFGSFAEWLYRSLFLLLLSVKGVAMWRTVRVASVSASLGENPIIHLGWNPF